jgi:uncharacterized surface anchored protein
LTTNISLRRGKSRWLITFVVVAMLTALTATVAQATLSGSTFESGDGNLAVNTTGLHDWNSPVEPISCGTVIPGGGTNCGLDLVKDGADNSLGQGSKEDNPNPTVVSGQIPPSKDDLSRFYVNKEKVGGIDFLYLAWERSNLLGSAHMDFEFNQSNVKAPNGVTINRTAGDLLIDFDFGGSGVPVLAKHTWITSGNPAALCEASNSLPCWDKAVDLGSFAEAAVNNAPVVDTNNPGQPRTLDGNTKNGINSTFGEAGINLEGSGIFSGTVCERFGFATLKSRSSGNSFTSELKDFIAPVPVNITNCGSVNIHKQDDLGAPLAGAVFTLYTDNAPVDGAAPHGAEDVATILTCTTLATGDCTIASVPFGNYWAVETTGVLNHDLAADQSFSLTGTTPNGTISLTFVDPRQPGAIKVTKTAKNHSLESGSGPLAGVKFTVNGVQKTTDANGEACFDGLTLGTEYTVTEDSAPTGYSIDTASKKVTPDHTASCTSGTPNAVSFTDTPLSEIGVTFKSLAGTGVTAGSIVCTTGTTTLDAVSENGENDPVLDDTDETFTNLAPGTYNCTIVVDP